MSRTFHAGMNSDPAKTHCTGEGHEPILMNELDGLGPRCLICGRSLRHVVAWDHSEDPRRFGGNGGKRPQKRSNGR